VFAGDEEAATFHLLVQEEDLSSTSGAK